MPEFFIERLKKIAKKGPEKNVKIGQDTQGIEIWNRSFSVLKRKLFPEESIEGFFKKRAKKTYEYWYTPAFTPFDPQYSKPPEIIKNEKPIASLTECFSKNGRVLELGCGGGEAAAGMASKHKKTEIFAVDHEWGKKIPLRQSPRKNLHFSEESWYNLSFPDNYFDTIFSLQGVGRYGCNDETVKELTRVAKPGALLRVDQERGLIEKPTFNDLLAKHGWDTYHLRGIDKRATNLIIGILKNKD